MAETTGLLTMDDVLEKGPQVAGAKAYNLAKVQALGHRIPTGIVLPCGFLPANSGNGQLQKLANSVLDWFREQPLAVRSSGIAEDGAEHSFAGQFATVLQVKDNEALKRAIQTCLQSAGSTQVRSYSNNESQALAVLIQQMVQATAAGVAFSANPLTGDRDEMVINAVKGLGDKLMGGEETPDEWVVKNGVAQCRNNKQGSLSEEQVMLIAGTVQELAKQMGSPQDVEWALEGDLLYILQSRPITALPPQPIPIEITVLAGTWKRNDHHTTMSPFTFEIFADTYDNAMCEAIRKIGLPMESIQSKMIGGHMYTSMKMQGGDQKKSPPAWLMWLLARVVPSLRSMNKQVIKVFKEKLHHNEIIEWEQKWKPYFLEQTSQFAAEPYLAFSNEDLLDRLNRLINYVHVGATAHANTMGHWIAFCEFGLFCEENLGWDIQQIMSLTAGWSKATTFVHDELVRLCNLHFTEKVKQEMVQGGRPESGAWLAAHPELKLNADNWISENALRMQDYDLVNPTLGENPGLIYQSVVDILYGMATDTRNLATQNRLSESMLKEAREKLKDTNLTGKFEHLLTWAKKAYSLRDENGLYTITNICSLLRLHLLEMGRRIKELESPEHIFFLYKHEIEAAIKGNHPGIAAVVAERRGQQQWARQNRGPLFYGPPEPPMPSTKPFPPPLRKMFNILAFMEKAEMQVLEDPAEVATNKLHGRGVSSGSYTGRACLVLGPQHFDRIRAGDIMVCRITSGEWGVVFGRLSGLVTEEGGFLSHPAIIAREFGLPAVTSVSNALQRIKHGDSIMVDGDSGKVTILQ